MSEAHPTTIITTEGRDLVATRLINATPQKVYRAWTEPQLMKEWTEADRESHEKMGFHQGWSACTEQLASLAERL